MGLAAKLQMRQAQSLVMTPQLMQSIRLLQLTHLELERFVDEEIERNPFLERAPEDAPIARPDEAVGDKTWTADAMADRLDTSLENVFPDDPGRRDQIGQDLSAQWKSAPSGPVLDGQFADLAETTAAATSLRDHVSSQAALAIGDPAMRLIAAELADDLDEAGYLSADMGELAARLGCDGSLVESTLSICQTFEPAGIFARSLAECLSLQLAARGRLDPAMRALLANLELLARRDFASLRRLCGVDEEDLVDMLAEIRSLDPKPGMAFASGTADIIVPDVIVRAGPDGAWLVELNAETLPRVLVDQIYASEIASRVSSASDREFLADCLQSANWLTRSLDQRARTILKVASEIVRQQDAFLLHGVTHLRPMNLRTIADAIGMHESTVSRVTANKYMMTPRGVVELRYFFTAAIAASGGGDAHSSEAVRHRIRSLIEAEPADGVLSDDTIVDVLRESGIDIARRTVAKYREGMSIPSSVQRRREKRAMMAAGRSAATSPLVA